MSSSIKIKNFIKAKSPRRLRTLMMQKQMQMGMASLSFDVMFDSSKKEYIAWFYEILSQETLKEVSDDSAESNRG